MRTIRLPILLLAGLLVACGKQGPPHPPVPIIPKGTSDLVVAQRGPKVVLSWSYPSLTTAGTNLAKFDRVIVYRTTEVLPASIAGANPEVESPDLAAKDVPTSIRLFKRLPEMPPRQFEKLKIRLDAIEAEDLPKYSSGASLLYEDAPQFEAEGGLPVRLTYAVVTEAHGNRSEPSNLATIVPLPPPPPPGNLEASAEPDGIMLKWKAPEQPEAASATPPVGYDVYRFPAEGPIVELGSPVNSGPIDTTTWKDAPPYGAYRYSVTTVASAGPPLIQSDPSPTVYAEFRDVVAPPTPANVAVLAEERAVQVVWDRVDAPDFGGYNVYRTANGKRELLTPTPIDQAFYRDESVVPGTTYVYSVTSVDKVGNESVPGESAAALVAR
ncbi:MAG: fibronectin type III domain-containing protein [Thermoanaerobaculia bacterium]